MHRVAITGIGIVSCLGQSKSEVLEALRQGKSGIQLVPERHQLGFSSALSGTIKNFTTPDIPKEFLRQMPIGGLMAVPAVTQTIEDARIQEHHLNSPKTGVIVGNIGNMQEVYQLVSRKVVDKKKLSALSMARTMCSSVSANLSILFGTKGYCMTVDSACASGANAIGLGVQQIRLGLQDRILAGGVQEGTWEFDILFDALRVFSRHEQEPERASRPFDVSRDGLVPASGAGFVLLENLKLAKDRGAHIYAELVGYATNSDGAFMTTPTGEGSVRCMKLALDDAGISPEQIDYINAHATGTPVGDAVEAKGIAEVFGVKPFVSSTKSMTGHEIAAAGATELVYSLLMMEHGFIAPTINLSQIDPECDGINHVANNKIDMDLRYVMSNSFGFGGVNTVLIMRKH